MEPPGLPPLAFGRAASALCAQHRCPRRCGWAYDLARNLSGTPAKFKERLVVSLSTLPGRIGELMKQLPYLERQTRPADDIYVAVPEYRAVRK